MQWTLIVLVAWASSLCAAGEKNPGLLIMHTEKSLSMWHQEVVLGQYLEENLKNISIPLINGNLSTISWSNFYFNLSDIKLLSYTSPKANVNISSAEGVQLNIDVPMIKLAGNHEVRYDVGPWDQGEWNGNFTLVITKISLRMKREIIILDNEKRKWQSTNLSGFIDDVEVHFNDHRLNTLFALVDVNLLKKLVLDNLFEACKNLTEVETDFSLKLTEDIYYDMSLTRPPVMHDGDVEFHHKAEAHFKGDNSNFNHEPLELVSLHPNKTMVYRITDFFFNSLGHVVHNHDVLSCNFTKLDLPENNKNLLDTTCEKDCFGKLFPEAAVKFPDSSIEFDMSTASTPYVLITPESFKGVLEINLKAKAKKGDESPKDVFNIYLCLNAIVELSVKNNKLRFIVEFLNPNVTVLDTKIGELDKVNLKAFIELVFEKTVIPIVAYLKAEGLDLKLPELMQVCDYELKSHNGDVALMLDFKEIKYVSHDNSSVRDLDSSLITCD